MYDDPGWGIADGRIKDLPAEDVSVETTHDLVDGGGVIPVVVRRGGGGRKVGVRSAGNDESP